MADVDHANPAKKQDFGEMIAFRRSSWTARSRLEMRFPSRTTPSAALLVVLIAVGSASVCQDGEKEKGEEPKPKVAIVKRVNPVCSLDLPCNRSDKLWVGPDKSTVHIVLTSGPECPASLALHDKRLEVDTSTAAAAKAGQQLTIAVNVPSTKLLRCICGGTGEKNCSCAITGVDPPLPPNVVLGPAQGVTPGVAVKDPLPGAVIPLGTPLVLSCGKQFPLWNSTAESYVTVTFKGSQGCYAKVTSSRIGVAGGSAEITDNKQFSRTFGPATSLTASCEGKGAGQCDFVVTETIQLP